MFIESRDFEQWMNRIMERFDRLENIFGKPEEKKKIITLDGERLYDNQDLLFLFHICKRTLQRYRTHCGLKSIKWEQKTYYKESDVKKFIEEQAERKKMKINWRS